MSQHGNTTALASPLSADTQAPSELASTSCGRRLEGKDVGRQTLRERRPASAGGPPECGSTVVRPQINNHLDARAILSRDDEGAIDGHRLTGGERGGYCVRGRDDLTGGRTAALAIVDRGGQHAGQRQVLTGVVRHRHRHQDTGTSHFSGSRGEVLSLELPQGDDDVPVNADRLVQRHLRVLVLGQVASLNGLGVNRGGVRGGDLVRRRRRSRRRLRGLDRRSGGVRGRGRCRSRSRPTGRRGRSG